MVASTCRHHGMPLDGMPGQRDLFTQWTPDKHHRGMVSNATHLDCVLVGVVKGFTGTLDQELLLTWHQVLWLGRGVGACQQ